MSTVAFQLEADNITGKLIGRLLTRGRQAVLKWVTWTMFSMGRHMPSYIWHLSKGRPVSMHWLTYLRPDWSLAEWWWVVINPAETLARSGWLSEEHTDSHWGGGVSRRWRIIRQFRWSFHRSSPSPLPLSSSRCTRPCGSASASLDTPGRSTAHSCISSTCDGRRRALLLTNFLWQPVTHWHGTLFGRQQNILDRRYALSLISVTCSWRSAAGRRRSRSCRRPGGSPTASCRRGTPAPVPCRRWLSVCSFRPGRRPRCGPNRLEPASLLSSRTLLNTYKE